MLCVVRLFRAAALVVVAVSFAAAWDFPTVWANEARDMLAQATRRQERLSGRTQRPASGGRAGRKPLRQAPGKGKPMAGRPAQPRPSATAPPTVPKVVLTEQHAKTCRVKVGDEMPDFQLPSIAGQAQALSALAGRRLTVVCFWDAENPYALEELGDLGPQVAAPFKRQGVNVVAVCEGSVARAAKVGKSAGAEFPMLVDRDGSVFKQVATKKLPRTYLLDPARRIIWFDLEYSRTTRRDLVQAIHASLANTKVER